MASKRTPGQIHVLLRYAASLTGLDDTISQHRAVLRSDGAVWFGKLGRPFGENTIAGITRQIETNDSPSLFLAAKSGRHFVLHRGEIVSMSRELPEGEQDLVPDYYARAGITARVGTWFKLSTLLEIPAEVLRDLVVATTGTPILSVLGSSRNSMFLVAPRPGGSLDR